MIVRILFYAAGIAIIAIAIPQTLAPIPKEAQVLSCRLAHTGKVSDNAILDGCEVTITNTSSSTVDIGTTIGPLAGLVIDITNPSGKRTRVNLAEYGSPSLEPTPLLLKSGESYRESRAVLFAIPDEERVAGTYKVKAVYTFKGQEAASDLVEIKWPGPK